METPNPAFSDPDAVSGYAERTARLVPGLRDLHRMAALLLAERAPAAARILVLGAGGGMETKAFAEMRPEWRFDAVDPSAEMLDLARAALGAHSERVAFHEGYVESAPDGPYDGAACLLTLHFLPAPQRLATLRAIRQRLEIDAPLVVAHHSFPNKGADPDRWLGRHAAFSGASAEEAGKRVETMKTRLPVLSPEEDEALLRKAGFAAVELFYAAFTFKGWVCRAARHSAPA